MIMSHAASRRRWVALIGIAVGLLAVGLDVTVLSLALPTLAGALRAGESELQWFVASYTLALTAAMLPAGLLGDRIGRRRLLLVALLVFGIASAGCAVAPGPVAFIAARVVLGAAGAAMTVMALSIITAIFDEAERPRAIGIWGAANFLALPLGPIVGGWVLANAWWGWVFLLNVPVVVLGIVVTAAFVPESRDPSPRAIDWVGVFGSSAALAVLMYGIIEAGRVGWQDPGTVGPFLAGLLGLGMFAAWEWRVGATGGVPLVDLGLFRSRAFTGGVVVAGIGIFGLAGMLFAMPQLWQAVHGVDAQGAGFRLLPLIGGMVVGALPSDRVASRVGPRTTAVAGLVVMAGAMVAGSTITVQTTDAAIAAWMFVAGVGAGIGMTTAASAAMVELDAAHSGVGSGLVQVVIKLGPALGAAILGSVVNGSYRAAVPVDGLPADAAAAVQSSVFGGLALAGQLGSAALAAAVGQAFTGAIGDALRVGGVIALAGVPIGIALLPRRARVAEERASQSTHEPSIVTG